MPESVWKLCTSSLQDELPSQQFNTWIRPLQIDGSAEPGELRLLAPNRFVCDWVNEKFLHRIRELVADYESGGSLSGGSLKVQIGIGHQRSSANSGASFGPGGQRQNPNAGSGHMQNDEARDSQFQGSASQNSPFNDTQLQSAQPRQSTQSLSTQPLSSQTQPHNPHQGFSQAEARHQQNADMGMNRRMDEGPSHNRMTGNGLGSHGQFESRSQSAANNTVEVEGALKHRNNLNRGFNFSSFVEGKSNQLGLAAARQVAENPGGSYNPLFIYGGVGLGKTHLMQAVGNAMVDRNPNAKVIYLHSERFVADMVKALQLNAINDFKRYYRSVDALLIDDIQFFAGKERSQEEFFHTFNSLLEGGQQIILTCDRYPKEINGLEERLKSRFGWGLTVAVEPPELETRVAILMKKADQVGVELPHEAAFFIAQRIRSNVRELEGALKRVIANAQFTGRAIDVDLVREALKDLLALQDKQVGIDNIQRVVGDYYKIKLNDLLSKRRSRSVARPRQVAMALAKELTNHSLPEIGEAFGGRDHTTVLHACRKIKQMQEEDADIREDMKNLLRSLTT